MSTTGDPKSTFENTPSGWASRWSAEFTYAKEFHRKWQVKGQLVVSKFLDRDTKTNDPQAPGYNLNLFSANVTTLQSMLYGRIPQVSVDRRWADPEDQVARVASEMAERLLNADIEEEGEDLSSVLKNCLQDRLLPGIGVARVRYDFDEGKDEEANPSEQETVEDAEEGNPEGEEEDGVVKKESEEDVPATAVKNDEWIEDIYVPWKDVMWSPARFWSEIRWIAFRTYKDQEELKRFLGEEEFKKLKLDDLPFNSKSPLEANSARVSEIWSKCELWEIWDKETKTVFWWVDGYNRILKSVEDPLELCSFFPCPPFFIANVTTTEYIPKADYTFAESLYREIDVLEERIALLTKAVKVVGVYDKKSAPNISRLINETAENKLIPVENWAMFAEKGGIKGVVDFFPLEDIVNALEQLQKQQQERISQLYQITGMADILRGDSPERSGVGTNQLKAKFASLRVQAIQDEFTRFATDLQKLRLEIVSKHFDAETIIRHSNIMLTYDDDPTLVMKAVEFLKDTEISKWRIIIAPESMAMVDYSQLRQERTEYINSLGIFLQSSAPIAAQYPEAAPVLMELLKWGLAGFKGSKQIEGVIDRALAAMQKAASQPKQQQPDPALQKIQMEMASDQQTHQQKLAEMGQKHQMEMTKLQLGFQIEMKELQARLTEVEAKMHQSSHEAANTIAVNASKPPPPLSLGQPPAPAAPAPSAPSVGAPPNALPNA